MLSPPHKIGAERSWLSPASGEDSRRSYGSPLLGRCRTRCRVSSLMMTMPVKGIPPSAGDMPGGHTTRPLPASIDFALTSADESDQLKTLMIAGSTLLALMSTGWLPIRSAGSWPSHCGSSSSSRSRIPGTDLTRAGHERRVGGQGLQLRNGWPMPRVISIAVAMCSPARLARGTSPVAVPQVCYARTMRRAGIMARRPRDYSVGAQRP